MRYRVYMYLFFLSVGSKHQLTNELIFLSVGIKVAATEKEDEATIALIPHDQFTPAASSKSDLSSGSSPTSGSWLRTLAMAAHVAALLFCGYIIYVAGPGSSESPPSLFDTY